jgi:ribosomal protein S12 methylthiotransferase
MPATREENIETVAFVSLGCPKNLVDSERMLGLLAADGLVPTDDHEDADAIVINTCGFLEASKTESMDEIRQAVALKEAGRAKRVVVAGCLVQRHKTKLIAEEPGIDRLVGVFDRDHIVDAVRGRRPEVDHFLGKYHAVSEGVGQAEAFAAGDDSKAATLLRKQASGKRGGRLAVFEDDRSRLRLTPRHYAYLRMSEGCNQGCAFCTIPSIRGPMRSKPIDAILAEANELAADGATEILLIGQDTTSYGTDINFAPGLAGLLRRLDKELPTDVAWVRLMYAYPSCFTDEMIDALAESRRVVKYVDMPLQHINDAVLGRMRRKVTRRETETLLHKLRDRVPGIALRTTMIAGSPGETETEHEELREFISEFGFDNLGVFGYSPEPGTPMGRADGQLPPEVIQRRVDELMLAQQEVAFATSAAMVGQKQEVLIDSCEGEVDEGGQLYVGRTARQAPDIDGVTYVHDPRGNLHPGQLVDAIVTDWQGYDHVATVEHKRQSKLNVLPATA